MLLKRSKSTTPSEDKTERDWEIVSYTNPNIQTDIVGGNIIDINDKYSAEIGIAVLRNYPIHSVRRLSDGIVFKAGEYAKCKNIYFRITDFRDVGNDLHIFGITDDNQTSLPKCSITYAEKIQPKEETKQVSTNNDDVPILSLNDVKALLKNICDGTYSDDIGRWNFVLGSSSNTETLYQSALRTVNQKLKQ